MLDEKGEYMFKFDHSRFRERIIDGYHLESFNKAEGFDSDYLMYEIMKSHQKPSMLHRSGVQIKDFFLKLYMRINNQFFSKGKLMNNHHKFKYSKEKI